MTIAEYAATPQARSLTCLWRADEGLYIAIDKDTGERIGHVIPGPPGSNAADAEIRLFDK